MWGKYDQLIPETITRNEVHIKMGGITFLKIQWGRAQSTSYCNVNENNVDEPEIADYRHCCLY